MRAAELPLPLGLLFGFGVPLILFRVFDLDDFEILSGMAVGCALAGALVGVAFDRHRSFPFGRRVLHAIGPCLGIPAGVAALAVFCLLVPGLSRGRYTLELLAIPLAAVGGACGALLLSPALVFVLASPADRWSRVLISLSGLLTLATHLAPCRPRGFDDGQCDFSSYVAWTWNVPWHASLAILIGALFLVGVQALRGGVRRGSLLALGLALVAVCGQFVWLGVMDRTLSAQGI
jgi:hypothetical protein